MFSGSSHASGKFLNNSQQHQKTSPSFGLSQLNSNNVPLINTQDIEASIAKTFSSLKKTVDNINISEYKLRSGPDNATNSAKVSLYPSEMKSLQNENSAANKEWFESRRNLNRSYDINSQNASYSKQIVSSPKVKAFKTSTSSNQHQTVRSDENDEIHIYLPKQESQAAAITSNVKTSEIVSCISKLKSDYEALMAKISQKTKVKDVKFRDDDIFALQNNMNEMNRLVEQLEGKKIFVKERNIMTILEKERRKFAKEKEKLTLGSEETIARLKSELEKALSAKKEFEIKVKMLEPMKFELEKKVKALDQEKKSLESEILRVQKDFASIQVEVEKYRILYTTKDKELKGFIEKYDSLMKLKDNLEEENKKLLPKLGKLEAENLYLKSDIERLISENQIKINELKREINDLNVRIKSLSLSITDIKAENDQLKDEIKEERVLKERILIDKMNLESRWKEADLEIVTLKRKIDELLRRPPQIIKETLPPIEKKIEIPVEKTILIDNPDHIREIEHLKAQCVSLENEILSHKERFSGFELEIRDREMEISHWKAQFQQLERHRFEEIEITTTQRIRALEQENEDLRYRMRFLSDELKRQGDMNQEKNQSLASQIRAITEKNMHLEEVLKYYKQRM